MRVFFGVTVLLSMLAFALNAQQVAKMTDTGIGYLEHLPPDYYTNTSKKYPVMVFLHGMGERGDGSPASLEIVKKNGPPYEISRGKTMCFMVNGINECFIVISPQLSTAYSAWLSNITEDVFKHVYANYRVDPERVYLTGLSLGGNGTYRYAGSSFNEPNELAAIAPIAAWDGGANACIIASTNMSVWAFHGDADPVITYDRGVAAYNNINNCIPKTTGELKFTTYAGVGHNSWWMTYLTDNSWHTPNVYEWLLSKRRASTGLPIANAGPDKNIELPVNSVSLQGTGEDPDGSIVAYNWRKISGPAATLLNANSPEVTLADLTAGTYVIELAVTDNDGNMAVDLAQVNVQAAPANTPPVANAGPDKTVTLPQNSITISATASDNDGSIVSYSWNQISGPGSATLSGNTTPTLQVSGLLEGTYVMRLTVVDDDGASGTDEMKIIVNPAEVNAPPVANAGNNILLNLPVNSTNIAGSASDPDGTVTSYVWTQVNGPSVASLTNANTPTVTVNGMVEGVYIFSLNVTDNDGASDSDEMTVTVQAANVAPVANAGEDKIVVLPTNTVILAGSGSDSDGTITGYIWNQLSGPGAASLANATTSAVTISGLIEGIYSFSLTVEDNSGAIDMDEVTVEVQSEIINQPPTAVAGNDITTYLPDNIVTVSGSGSDSDGSVVSYTWTKTSGPEAYTIAVSNASQTEISNLVAGTYQFTLTVTDNDGTTGSDDIIIYVIDETSNISPYVNAGTNRQITLPDNSIVLIGDASDGDGTIVSTIWEQTSGPSAATISGESSLTVTLSDLTQGTYVFSLTATDNDGASSTDEVMVIVNAANVSPLVNAGNDINIQLPQNTIAITGTASDPDGTISALLWTQESGPSTALLSGQNGLNITISQLQEGTYLFRLSATDDKGATTSDDVKVTVSGVNSVPLVSAGTDKTLTLPTNTVVLSGSATDSDGTIVSYLWTKSSGPDAILLNENTAALTAQGLIEGIYVFLLTATDNEGGQGSDEVMVTVNSAIANQPPTANAGNDIQLTLPVNSTNLVGSGSDSDGSVIGYAWTKISGGTVTIVNAGNATVSLNDLQEGVYEFELTVTDDDNDTGKDRVRVTLSSGSVNQAPVANAGSDKLLILPDNAVTLEGTGSDNDGSVLTYLWEKVSGGNANMTGNNSPTLNATELEEGIYQFTLKVTDEKGASDTDGVRVVVLPESTNNTPVVNAGLDQAIKLPTNTITLNGSASDADGTIITYLWRKTAGPAGGTISNSNSPVTTITDLVEGVYSFTLVATDDDGASGSDKVDITVLSESTNAPPVVNAGNDVTVRLPENVVTLYGKGTDIDGSVVSYEWIKISGPSSLIMDTPNRSSVRLSSLIEGTYTIRLIVADDKGARGSDEVVVTVLSEASNIPPYVNAGADKVLFLPVNSTNFSGTAIDPDGTIQSIQWSKASGGNAVITEAETLTPRISGLEEGTYVFRLSVTDNSGASATDQLRVFVQPTTVNQPPTVNAGQDLHLILPQQSGILKATMNDPDGIITSVKWVVLNGTSPEMTGVTTQELQLTNLDEGLYSFQVTVIDDDGLSASDVVHVTVSQKEMIPPIISIMDDITIQTDQTILTLLAEVVDDGEVIQVGWEQVLGPPITLESPQNMTSNALGWKPGTYEFRFTAIDDDQLSASESVVIYVFDEDALESAFPMKMITPNGDYDNERWILDPDISKHADCTLSIFNRQGQEVYSVTGYANQWDATLNNEELAEGVYYYFLTCEEKDRAVVTGSITVIR